MQPKARRLSSGTGLRADINGIDPDKSSTTICDCVTFLFQHPCQSVHSCPFLEDALKRAMICASSLVQCGLGHLIMRTFSICNTTGTSDNEGLFNPPHLGDI